MESCIFCKIVKGELPSYKIYDDNEFIAFLDIHPRTKGHTLVIPKQHYRWTYDVPNFEAYWSVVKKITEKMQGVLQPEFITYVTHGLEVEHAHIHIMPRMKGEVAFVPDIKSFSKEVFEDIRNTLNLI